MEEYIGSPAAKRKLVLIYHDESKFHANEGPTWQWAEKGKLTIRPKSIGRGTMVSDFITEHHGYLKFTKEEFEEVKMHDFCIPKEARVLFKYGAQTEGYWNCEKFINQVKDAVKIAEVMYPTETHSLAFIFDQSSGHTSYAKDGLNAHRTNVNYGGKQPKHRTMGSSN